jgi:hypothetical protein
LSGKKAVISSMFGTQQAMLLNWPLQLYAAAIGNFD